MSRSLDIVFENDEFLLVNKASGTLAIPDRTQSGQSLKDLLAARYGQIFTVHRLDRDTSGLIVFAKTPAAHQWLSRAFESRSVEKFYWTVVQGTPVPAAGSIEAPMAEHLSHPGKMVVHKKGKAALSTYRVLEDFGIYSFLEVQIFTGRTHQIRVHMQHLGHPVVCDELYGNGNPVLLSSIKRAFKLSKDQLEEKPLLGRLALHAHRLKFQDPKGLVYALDAPLPKDLRAFLNQLRKWHAPPGR